MFTLKALLAWCLPPACVGCGHAGHNLCYQCLQNLDFYWGEVENLQHWLDLDAVFTLSYFETPLSTLLHQLKYSGMFDYAVTAAQLIWQHGRMPRADFLLFVPLHRDRQHMRGYNQSQLIAQKLSTLSGVPCLFALQKNRATQSQVNASSRESRMQNLSSVFSLNPIAATQIMGKSCIIIDDVVTTGATFAACAQVLKKAGAKLVYGVAVAHE